MKSQFRKFIYWISRRIAGPELAALEARLKRTEAALTQAHARNQDLTQQLNQQREKTRELYARTKEYAARLNAGARAPTAK